MTEGDIMITSDRERQRVTESIIFKHRYMQIEQQTDADIEKLI